jgi:hypothetical protein
MSCTTAVAVGRGKRVSCVRQSLVIAFRDGDVALPVVPPFVLRSALLGLVDEIESYGPGTVLWYVRIRVKSQPGRWRGPAAPRLIVQCNFTSSLATDERVRLGAETESDLVGYNCRQLLLFVLAYYRLVADLAAVLSELDGFPLLSPDHVYRLWCSPGLSYEQMRSAIGTLEEVSLKFPLGQWADDQVIDYHKEVYRRKLSVRRPRLAACREVQ